MRGQIHLLSRRGRFGIVALQRAPRRLNISHRRGGGFLNVPLEFEPRVPCLLDTFLFTFTTQDFIIYHQARLHGLSNEICNFIFIDRDLELTVMLIITVLITLVNTIIAPLT